MSDAARLLSGRLTFVEWSAIVCAGVAVVTWLAFTYVRGIELRAVDIFAELGDVANAMRLAKLDSNCWPSRLDALVAHIESVSDSCNNASTGRLRPPYLAQRTFDRDGAMKLTTGSTAAWVRFQSQSERAYERFVLRVGPLPEPLAGALVALCYQRDVRQPKCFRPSAEAQQTSVLWRLE